jgi:DNA-binding transcriptional regulator YiaG
MGGRAMTKNILGFQHGFQRSGETDVDERPLHYTACGLDDVYLLNGFKREIVDGEEYVTIADLEGLWKAIGLHLVTTRKALAPKEIKFLRQHMDLTQAELGARLRVSDQTVARWEKDQCDLPGPADLMLRVLFLGSPAARPKGNEILRKFTELLDELHARDESKSKADVFEQHGKRWQDSEREIAPMVT